MWRAYRVRATPSCGSALHFLPAALPTVMLHIFVAVAWYSPNRADRFVTLPCTSNRKLSLLYRTALSVYLCVCFFFPAQPAWRTWDKGHRSGTMQTETYYRVHKIPPFFQVLVELNSVGALWCVIILSSHIRLDLSSCLSILHVFPSQPCVNIYSFPSLQNSPHF